MTQKDIICEVRGLYKLTRDYIKDKDKSSAIESLENAKKYLNQLSENLTYYKLMDTYNSLDKRISKLKDNVSETKIENKLYSWQIERITTEFLNNFGINIKLKFINNKYVPMYYDYNDKYIGMNENMINHHANRLEIPIDMFIKASIAHELGHKDDLNISESNLLLKERVKLKEQIKNAMCEDEKQILREHFKEVTEQLEINAYNLGLRYIDSELKFYYDKINQQNLEKYEKEGN